MGLDVKRAIYCGIIFGLSESALFYLTSLLFYYASVLLASKDFSLNSIQQCLTLLLFSVSNTTMIMAAIPGMSIAREGAQRLLRLASLPNNSHEHEGTTKIRGIGNIAFSNVSFTYPTRPETLILKNVSISIPTGTCVSLVGLSGSGKSTIASLLLNLYPITDGSSGNISPLSAPSDITFGGRSIKRIHTPTLRSLISIVTQTPTLIPGTISENISYGLPSSSSLSTRLEVKAAAKAAGIDYFVSSLPDGYDTLVGEGGTGLSGGQAQRIAIARAIVRRPNVLILDEATSALDRESAKLIRDTIRRLLEHDRAATSDAPDSRLTVIVITHSRDMMRLADWVCVLDDGCVVETGEFDELVKSRGRFASLVKGEMWEKDEMTKKRKSVRMMKRASGIVRSPLPMEEL